MEGTKEQQEILLVKVKDVSASVKAARRVEEVVSCLHSLVVCILPHEAPLVSGSVDCCSCDQVEIPSDIERKELWNAFYRGPAFHILAQVLLLDVATNWLSCFPLSVKKHVYDSFFTSGLASEVLQLLVSSLQSLGRDDFDFDAVQSNVERLLILCLLENNGVVQIVKEFGSIDETNNLANPRYRPVIPSIAQIIASIPDKARSKAPKLLSSSSFFKNIVTQLLEALFQGGVIVAEDELLARNNEDNVKIFAGEIFSRVCRRGSTDVLLSQVIPRVVSHVRTVLSSTNPTVSDVFESDFGLRLWSDIVAAIRDSYAFEKFAEKLLIKLEMESVSDIEGYWILWILYSRLVETKPSVRSLFVDKLLLWRVFPICCARWIIQFAVLQCPPLENSLAKLNEVESLLDCTQEVASVWSKREFVQSATLEQQAYVTAVLGLCLQLLTKEELERSKKTTMHSVLQGVSCRLESPIPITRKMASCVALVFSKAIDPKNPLYLDEELPKDASIDWEFGLIRRSPPQPRSSDAVGSSMQPKTEETKRENGKSSMKIEFMDPDEVVDPAMLDYCSSDDNGEDGASEFSASSDESLQPYDLADDDSDFAKNFANLGDVIAALRKSDDPDGVERALDVSEMLVRASPDELKHAAGDLARALLHLRCSDIAVEGEEDSAEEKRQRSLVALLVTSPFQSVESLNKMLYSPNLDTSQRIVILDTMAEAAQELAETKTITLKNPTRPLISDAVESQPWFLPRNSGPPGAGLWKQVSETGTLLNYSHRYERELPARTSALRHGKTRRWSAGKSTGTQEEARNKFPLYAAAFMLPAMESFDKKRHGVDLLGRDFIVLGKLIYMLGVCMNCVAMHPEASLLAPPLLDMLKSSDVSRHKEAYVRRSVLFAASSVLSSLHPSFVASALAEGNPDICLGLEWIREWALHVAENDSDRNCYEMAIACLKCHSEMALKASRVAEESTAVASTAVKLPGDISRRGIKMPFFVK